MPRVADALSGLVSRREAPGGAAILFRGTDIVWSGAQGQTHAPDTADGPPMRPSTKARVASISKVATALTLIRLAEQGRVDLDYDASVHLGFTLRHPAYPDAPITPRMILSHCAGLRDGESYRGVVGETLAGYLQPGGRNWDDGSRWAKQDVPLGHFSYCNLAMGLIAQMVEVISGMRFDLCAKQLVFDPLGLGCGFNWSGVPDADAAAGATLYRRKSGAGWEDANWEIQLDADPMANPRPTFFADPGLSLADYVVGTNGLMFSPQGGLRASVEDLAVIGMALTGAKPLLAPATRKMLAEPQWTYREEPVNGDTFGGAFQGFGTGVHRLIPGAKCPIPGLSTTMIGHYGEAYGLFGGLWVDPVSQAGFAWFVTGSHHEPAAGSGSGLYGLEETMMVAAAQDLGLA